MKKLCLLPFAALGLALSACSDEIAQPETLRAPSRSSLAVDDSRYLVAYNNGTKLSAKVAELGGRLEFTHDASGIAVVSGLTAGAATTLGSSQGVTDIMQDAEITVARPGSVDRTVSNAVATSVANPAGAAYYAYQWNMHVIKAGAAWAAGKLGSSDVTIAILDSGIDYENPDLNGKVDLARSKSFIPSDDALLPLIGIASKHPVMDLNGHGTNVAAQAVSNAVYFAGVNSKATLMGVKVLGWNGSGSTSAILQGLIYAADQGADVVNMSIGYEGGISRGDGFGGFVKFVNRAFNYAHRQGVVVVVSAGNDAIDIDHNGASYSAICEAPNAICTSATGPASPGGSVDALTDYSNFGRSAISVAAPGGTGSGWVYSLCARYSLWPQANGSLALGCYHPAGYYFIGFAGTSQASPHVAGLAGLLVVELGKNNPAAVKHAIQKSADDLGQPGTDPSYGKGRINVANALGL